MRAGAESRGAWALRLAREALAPGTDPLRRRRARRGLAEAARERLPVVRSIPRRAAATRYDAGFPPAWRDHLPERPSRRCVVLHASAGIDPDPDALPGGPGLWDLVVLDTGPSGQEPRAGWANVLRLPVPQDLGGGRALLALAHAGLLDSYEVVLHVETAAGDGLLAPDVADRAVASLRQGLSAGLVAGGVDRVEPTRAQRRRVEQLLARLELVAPPGAWPAPTPDFWVRGFLVQGLRALGLSLAGLTEVPPEDVPLLVGLLAEEAGCRVDPASAVPPQTGGDAAPPGPRARIVPFYLPQFHPTPENDRWWGRGFTEWTNVTAAEPVYTGHRQPRLPQDLGFYDLRLDEVRKAQAELAREHGVAGFLYYHYWFSGRRVLEHPLDAHVAGDLDLPFALMWANENWTRTWDGGEASVLLEQNYSDGAAVAFIDDALPYLRDPRCLRVAGRALLSVYRPGRIPDLAGVVTAWRRRAAERGVELFLVAVDVPEAFGGLVGGPAAHGFDAVMGFPPHGHRREWASTRGRRVDARFEGHLWSYAALVAEDEDSLRLGLPDGRFPTVMAGFDNTPRRQWTSTVFMGANPYTFRRWLAAAADAVAGRPEDRRLVFVNAWNEWAEGAVLEPDTRSGRSYLLAIRDVAGPQPS